jgi:hypothetical protein
VKRIVWTDPAKADVRSLSKPTAMHILSALHRFAESGAGMGHANIDVTQNVYNKTWWEERVEAVSMAAASVWREFMSTPQVPAAM